MDPILLFLGIVGFIIVSAISSFLEKKQQREREREERRSGRPGPQPEVLEQPDRRASAPDWQEQLRRLLQPESAETEEPPPIIRPVRPQQEPRPIKPVLIHRPDPRRPAVSPLDPSTSASDKASQLQDKVAARVQKLEDKKSDMAHAVKSEMSVPRRASRPQPARHRPVQQSRAVRLVRNHSTIRDAFVASVILGKPLALSQDQDRQ